MNILVLLMALIVQAEYFRLDFDIERGSSRSERGPGRKPFAKRNGFTMDLENEQTFYLARLKMGSNENENQVLVDTGSSDLWVMSHDLRCESARLASKRDLNSRALGDKIHVGSIFVDRKKGDGEEGDGDGEGEGKLNATRTFVKGHGKDFGDSFFSVIGFETTTVGGGGSGGSGGGSSQETDDIDGGIGGFGSGSGGANTCTEYGSFHTGESDSFSRNDSAPPFAIQYADGTEARGIFGHDDVKIGNTTVNDLSFAIANVTSSDIGVLGIGLPGLETTYSSNRNGRPYMYENLPLKLRNQGVIEKSAYSVYLGEHESEGGTVLFGAVDHAKYRGQLVTVPVVNSMANMGYDDAIRLEINTDGVSFHSGGDGDETQITSNSYTALLDTGSTLSYFPQELFERLGNVLGLDYSSRIGAYVVDCDTDTSANVSFSFGSGAITIDVPMEHLIVQSSSRTCILGILPQSSSSSQNPYMLLGDNFLRDAYVVYDLEDLTISLAAVNHTDEEDIEMIGGTIPGASSASGAATQAATGGSEPTGGQLASFGDNNDDGESKDSLGGKVKPVMGMVVAVVIGAVVW